MLDEAHHVEEIARQTMSTMVSSMRLPVLLFQIRRLDGCNLDAVNTALGLNNEFFAAVAEYGPGGRGGEVNGESGRFLLPDSDRLRSLGEDLLRTALLVKTGFATDLLGEREEALLSCLDRYGSDLQGILEADDDNKVFWVEMRHSSRRQLVTLHATCLDVSGHLAQSLFENEDVSSVIMTSATLSIAGSFDYLKNAVGCASALEASLPSPFNFARQCLFYMPPLLPDPQQPGLPHPGGAGDRIHPASHRRARLRTVHVLQGHERGLRSLGAPAALESAPPGRPAQAEAAGGVSGRTCIRCCLPRRHFGRVLTFRARPWPA